MARQNKEYQLAKAISQYMRMQYPKVPFRWDMAGLNLSIVQASLNKMIQYNKSWPDLFIAQPSLVDGSQYHGLFLEIKKEGTKIYKKTDASYATEHLELQAKQLDELNKIGYVAFFAVGFEEAKELIDGYLGGNMLKWM